MGCPSASGPSLSLTCASNELANSRAFVITGPSGVGKGTLISELLKARDDVELSVSATTRAPRSGERDGIEYTFLSPLEFEEGVKRREFLEYAKYAGHMYGTPMVQLEERLHSGNSVIMEIEIEGARQVKLAMPDAIEVFISPPSLAELKCRLVNRGTDSSAEIEARLAAAMDEIAAASEFDKVIVNNDVERAARELIEFVASSIS